MRILSILLLILGSSVAFAQKYGEAGCGLGSVVMGTKDNQVLAATTNGSSYTQMFGISSGTSNCTDDGAVRSSSVLPMYIETNKLVLAKEAARGEGDVLAGLANIMGCERKAFGQDIKAHYNDIFVESNMDAKAIETRLDEVASSSSACGA